MTDRASAIGLCAGCRHAVVQRSAKGSEFWRCRAADVESEFELDVRPLRYPPLPVVRCGAHQPGTPERSD